MLKPRRRVAHGAGLAALLLLALIGYKIIPRAGGSSPATFPGIFWAPVSLQSDTYGGGSLQVGTAGSTSPCVVPNPTAPDGQTDYYTDSPEPFGRRPTFHTISLRLVRHVTVGLRQDMSSYGGSSPGPPRGRLAIRYSAFVSLRPSSPLPQLVAIGSVGARWVGKFHPKHFVVTLSETVQLNAFGTDVSEPAVAFYVHQNMRWRSGQSPETGFNWGTDCPNFTAMGPVVGLRVNLDPAVQTSAGTVGITPQSAQQIVRVNG